MKKILKILWEIVLFLIILSFGLNITDSTSGIVYWGIILIYNQIILVGVPISGLFLLVESNHIITRKLIIENYKNNMILNKKLELLTNGISTEKIQDIVEELESSGGFYEFQEQEEKIKEIDLYLKNMKNQENEAVKKIYKPLFYVIISFTFIATIII